MCCLSGHRLWRAKHSLACFKFWCVLGNQWQHPVTHHTSYLERFGRGRLAGTAWREKRTGKPAKPPCSPVSTQDYHHTPNPEPSPIARSPFLLFSQTHMLRWALAGTQETRARGEGKKGSGTKSPLRCYYTHQTSLIRQQQNFINRMDIIEWACYKWALSGPYSATKWVFSVQCSHLRHHA